MTKAKPDAVADLLPTAEVARLAKANTATVNRWAKSGRLPVAVKIPGKTGANLYRREDVSALLAELAAEQAARAVAEVSA
jgi:predicted site-specific integrase-resolvase